MHQPTKELLVLMCTFICEAYLYCTLCLMLIQSALHKKDLKIIITEAYEINVFIKESQMLHLHRIIKVQVAFLRNDQRQQMNISLYGLFTVLFLIITERCRCQINEII